MVNSMVSGYASSGFFEEALHLFERARRDFCFKPTEFSFGKVITASAELAGNVGEQLHGFAAKCGFDADQFVGTSLVDMYGSLGNLGSMAAAFKSISRVDLASYNAMIVGSTKNGSNEDGLRYFKDLVGEGFVPNERSFSSAIRASGGLRCSALGSMLHCLVEKSVFQSDLFVNTALVDMYMKCGEVQRSCRVFSCMRVKNTVSYNSMIHGHGMNDNCGVAWSVFHEMKLNRVGVDIATFVPLMSSCLEHEWEAYAQAIKHGFGSDVTVETALLHSLIRKGSAGEALGFFNKMREKNVVSWTAIISGMTHLGLYTDALVLFKALVSTTIHLNSFTFSSALKACAGSTFLNQGRCIHGSVVKHGAMDSFTSSSLLDLYVKCGELADSRNLFEELGERDIVSWNAVIAGYGRHGHGREALELYAEMKRCNMGPNEATFVSLLSACSSCGLVEDGVRVFEEISSIGGLVPSMEHYACMVDVLGRAGMLDRAYGFIREMPIKADARVWTVFLSSCKLHGNVELSEAAMNSVAIIQGLDKPTQVLMSNVYAEVGRWDCAEQALYQNRSSRVRKEAGVSWVQVTE